ncbi:hypothetical protein LWI28_001067 [Acer negundo]|uniref:Uncharacterized protein n=1 Tax=Acer negundo TaxID=4023 RepID=A0AAD5NMJ7_ACENE|nr:hypothetical protein LWI28_001067 [Acer negundo]
MRWKQPTKSLLGLTWCWKLKPVKQSQSSIVLSTRDGPQDDRYRNVIEEVVYLARTASYSVMYPTVILPAAPLVSSSPSSVSLIANVGISLRSSRPTDTPPLTSTKSQTSLPVKLSTPPTARSSLSEIAARASRVRNIPGQIQRQASATFSMKPDDLSLVSPPHPPPIVPSRSQLRVDRAKETAVILLTTTLVSSSPSSVSHIANVGISLVSSRPIDTPHLTPAKFQTSLPAKLFTPPTVGSPLSEMAARASRVRKIPG